MTLTAPVSIREDDGGSAKASRTSIVPHGTETTSRQVDDEATDTTNPHAKCAGPTRPVGTPHGPADERFDEQEGGGMAAVAKAESVSMPIEGRSGRMPIDRADEMKPLGDDPSDMAEKFQGDGTGGRRGGDKTDTSGAPEDEEDNLEWPTKLRNVSERKRAHSNRRSPKYSPGRPQVELDGPDGEADASGGSVHVEDTWDMPKNPRNASELERERSERRDEENSPREPRGQLREPDDEAVTSSSPHST